MKFSWNRFSRKIHYWGALTCALPILVVIATGLVLQLKKDVSWVQPTSQRGEGKIPTLAFERILEIATTVSDAEIKNWGDVDRLDVRPKKGIVKVRAKNRWEIQVDSSSGKILQVAYRRSDLIESLHDGSFFHDKAKLWIFLPCAVILLILWISGIYLFLIPILSKRKRRIKQKLPRNEEKSTPSQALGEASL